MTPYLRTHKPARSQFRSPRRLHRSPLPGSCTGLTVVHTAESVMDTIGPDTGAENVSAFIRRRSDPGSYHDLVDSDSNIQLVDYGDEAYQDGTGSNPWALSISWALRASDWTRLTPERRDAFLRQGAAAFARQQAWLRAHDYPTTPLRRISKADSDRGQAGFIGHGERDPDRRTDPGAHFPWKRFFELCAATTPTTPTSEEDDMSFCYIGQHLIAYSPLGKRRIESRDEVQFWQTKGVLSKDLPKGVEKSESSPALQALLGRLPWLEPSGLA